MMKDSDAEVGLGALAHRMRLKIFRALIGRGPAGMTHGELASVTGLALSNLSFHLAKLEVSGLVTSERAGRQVFYRCDTRKLRNLLAFLTQDCLAGKPETCDRLIDQILPELCD